jgi:hypothetical protein
VLVLQLSPKVAIHHVVVTDCRKFKTVALAILWWRNPVKLQEIWSGSSQDEMGYSDRSRGDCICPHVFCFTKKDMLKITKKYDYLI